MANQFKCTFLMAAFHNRMPVQGPAAFAWYLIQLPINTYKEAEDHGLSTGAPATFGKLKQNSGLLISSWSSPSHYSHLWSEPVNGRLTSLCHSAFQTNKEINLIKLPK